MTLIIMFIIGIVRIFLSLYVDNILIVGNNVAFINKLKYFLKSNFKIKDLVEALYVMGIEIIRDRKCRTLYLSREQYLYKIVKRLHMHNFNPMNILILAQGLPSQGARFGSHGLTRVDQEK